MAVPKREAGRLAYISEFVEEAKASGLVQRAIEPGGLRGVHVAPREIPNNSRCQNVRAHISARQRDVSSWPEAWFAASQQYFWSRGQTGLVTARLEMSKMTHG